MKNAPLLIILAEIGLIGFIVFNIWAKIFVSKQYINPIDKESVAFNPTDKLKYFYEPRPGTTEGDLEGALIKAKYTIIRIPLTRDMTILSKRERIPTG